MKGIKNLAAIAAIMFFVSACQKLFLESLPNLLPQKPKVLSFDTNTFVYSRDNFLGV